jgi:helicase
MTEDEFVAETARELENLQQASKYINHRNQVIAWKLSAEFLRSYDEHYLWSRALFLSTGACMIFQSNTKLSIRSLREAAVLYENLSDISEHYDRQYCRILSALCYDISGYQANAVCMIRGQEMYTFSSGYGIELRADNYILSHIQRILLKHIPLARTEINRELDIDPGIRLLNNFFEQWYTFILTGNRGNYEESIEESYNYYLDRCNIPISGLLFLLKTRVKLFDERSIWNTLNAVEQISTDLIWNKYIKLLGNDIYSGNRIKETRNRFSKFEFWTSQLRAVQKGILSLETSFVVQMPTSAGKTFIAELAILNALVKNPGSKCLYISPFRALTHEKENELSHNLSKLGYSVSAMSGTYEIDEYQDLILSETDVLIATPEKIDLLFRVSPDYFNAISLVVVDEGHIVGDVNSRSTLMEFLIIRLRRLKPNLKTFFISAVMPPLNANQYSKWLSGDPNNVVRSLTHEDSGSEDQWEPTRKLIGSFTWQGQNGIIAFKNLSTENEETRVVTPAFVPGIIKKKQFAGIYPDGLNKAQTSAALAYRLSQEGNTLVFCAQPRETERVGLALLNILFALSETEEVIPEQFNDNTETQSYFFALKWFGPDSYITRCIKKGIGVHFGDLPEAVRRSVEEDFVNGKFKVLISTNTIGQGLNFPIKNLIFHSTILTSGPSGTVYVSVRDFWNIIGRAGRAGVETEGQIVFVIKSAVDRSSYERYTEKVNIEPGESMFFKLLKMLYANRISQNTLENYLALISEPYLLNIIAEETVEQDTEDIITSIIGQSLFNVQIQDSGLNAMPLRTAFRKSIDKIRETLAPETISVFGQTGFCMVSNQNLLTFVEARLEEISTIVAQDQALPLIKLMYDFLSEHPVVEIHAEKMLRLGVPYTDLFEVSALWIVGTEIDELQQEWRKVNEDVTKLNLLISEGFYYRLPWLINSMLTIICFRMELNREDLPENLQSLTSFIKYGLNDPGACLLRSMGVKNRDVALTLSQSSGNLKGKPLMVWTANLNMEDLQPLNLNLFDQININNISLRLAPSRLVQIPESFEFYIKGITYLQESMDVSLTIFPWDDLRYAREPLNAYDPYAIAVYYQEVKLGYVPRETAKPLSVELDINMTEYQIQIVEINPNETHADIKILMTKIAV